MTAAASQPPPLRLLIVDDHIDSARALSRLFRHEGYVVITAHSVTGALALVVGQPPIDVLVSDIGLPDGDGCDLLARLRTFYGGRSVAAIALSGLGDHRLIDKCKQAGYAQFLVKPVTFDRVLDAIRSLPAVAGATTPATLPDSIVQPIVRPLGGVPAPFNAE